MWDKSHLALDQILTHSGFLSPQVAPMLSFFLEKLVSPLLGTCLKTFVDVRNEKREIEGFAHRTQQVRPLRALVHFAHKIFGRRLTCLKKIYTKLLVC